MKNGIKLTVTDEENNTSLMLAT